MNLLKKYYNDDKDDFELFTIENRAKRNFTDESMIKKQLDFRMAKKNIQNVKNERKDIISIDRGMKPLSQYKVLLSKLRKKNVKTN